MQEMSAFVLKLCMTVGGYQRYKNALSVIKSVIIGKTSCSRLFLNGLFSVEPDGHWWYLRLGYYHVLNFWEKGFRGTHVTVNDFCRIEPPARWYVII